MCGIFVPDKSLLYTKSSEIVEICDVIFGQTPISHFHYTKLSFDGNLITLSNHPDWQKYFFGSHFYEKHYPAKCNLNSDYVFVEQRFPNIGKDARVVSGIYHMFSIIQYHSSYYEVYGFATNSYYPAIYEYYINYLDDLKKFILHFKDKAFSILQQYDAMPISWNLNEEINSYEQVNRREIDTIHSQISDKIDINKVVLPGRDRFVLSRREYEVLLLLGKGLTMKEAARILVLSPRTIESYVNDAKLKLGVYSKRELIDMVLAVV